MGRRVKTTTVREEIPPEPIIPNVDLSGDMSNIGVILSQFTESALKVEIYKDEMGHMEYCETIRGSVSIDKDSIRDTWGGGKFELRVYENDTLETTIAFRIAKKPVNNNPVVNQQPSMDVSFLQKMVLTLLTRGSDSPSFKDMIEMVTKFNNPSSPEKTLEVLMRGMELGKSGNASADWKSELIHTVKELGKDILPTVVEIAASRTPANGNGNHAQQIPPTSQAILKQGIALLKQKVIQGLPVGLALDWIVANGADYQSLIAAMLKSGYETLEELDPELKNEPYKTWFTTLYDGLKNVYTGNSNDENSDGESGDMGNTQDDGSLG